MVNILDATAPVNVAVQSRPKAGLYGALTYSPGQTVYPGTVVTINYQVQNIGGAGAIWGGLYDNAAPTPNLIGGYWEAVVAPGSPVSKSVAITVNADFSGQLLFGHIE